MGRRDRQIVFSDWRVGLFSAALLSLRVISSLGKRGGGHYNLEQEAEVLVFGANVQVFPHLQGQKCLRFKAMSSSPSGFGTEGGSGKTTDKPS